MATYTRDSTCVELHCPKAKVMLEAFSNAHGVGSTATIFHGDLMEDVHQYKNLGTVNDDKVHF